MVYFWTNILKSRDSFLFGRADRQGSIQALGLCCKQLGKVRQNCIFAGRANKQPGKGVVDQVSQVQLCRFDTACLQAGPQLSISRYIVKVGLYIFWASVVGLCNSQVYFNAGLIFHIAALYISKIILSSHNYHT